MKKQLFNLLGFLLLCTGINAQVTSYGFSQANGTYVPIPTAGATTVHASGWDDAVATATIPFSFSFSGTSYTTCSVNTNGYLTFGTTVSSTTGYTPISAAAGYNGAISAFGRDLADVTPATNPIICNTIGVAPNRTFIVQWTNVNRYNGATRLTGDSYNFQISLHEGGGIASSQSITIVYGVCTTTNTAAGIGVQVGLRGSVNTDFLNRTTATDWLLTTAGTSNTVTAITSPTLNPTSGLTFIYTPPALCTAPGSQATGLVFGVSSNSVTNGSFTPTTASGYIVIRTLGTAPNTPTNGVTYTTGTSAALGGTVVAVGTGTTFAATGLTGNTNYSYYIYSYNALNCSGGPAYNTTTPLTGTATTCPARATALTSGTITTNSFNIGWTAPAGGSASPITYSVEVSTNAGFTAPIPGSPFIVAAPTTSLALSGLNPTTVHYYRVSADNGCNTGPTAVSTATTSALTTDLQAQQLQSPVVNATGCYGTHTVTIRIRNAGTSTLDFSTNNATINGSVAGPNPMAFTTVVITTGTLAAGATQDVVLSSAYSMSVAGVYTFDANATLATPDANTSNDAIAPRTYTTTAGATLPQLVTFTGYTSTSASLNTAFPGWNEGSGTVTPTIGSEGSFSVTAAAQTTSYTTGAKMNLYSSNNGWIISPKFVPTASHVFRYKATLVGYNATNAVNFGVNDTVRAMVSTNCGATWTPLRTFNSTTNQGLDNTTNALREYTENLSTYAGQPIMVAIYARRTSGTSPDIDILVDDLQIFIPPTCYPPTALTTTNTTTTTTDLSFTTPVLGTPANYVYEVRTSGAAGSGTLGVAATGTIVAPSTSVTVTGLTAFTGYTVYVVSDCGAGDMSAWSAAATFTTLANCQVPTALNTTSVMATSATFTWVAGGSETAWDVYYGTQPLTVPTATTAATATTSVASYTTSVLTQTTAYSVYVRANCGAGNTSIWTAVNNFTTPASCPVPTNFTVSAITPTSAVATWTAGTTETSWLVKYSAPTMTAIAGPTPSYTMGGLMPSTNYSVQVKGICAAGDSSLWTVVRTFMTPCQPADISVTGNVRCGIGSTTLMATSTNTDAVIQWYTAPTGGSAIATGTTYVTPTISSNTTYYATSTANSTEYHVGPLTNTAAISYFITTNWGITFNAATSTKIKSVAVYPGSAGTVTISVQSNAAGSTVFGTYVATFTSADIAQKTIVPLNIDVPAGTGYKVLVKGYSAGFTGFHRESTTGFPYTAAGSPVTLTSSEWGGTTTGTFYFFYDFVVETGCESARAAVTATVTAPPALTFNTPAPVCGGSGIATLSVTSNVSDYDSYIWSPTTGLYTDASATIPYTGTNATVVYVNDMNQGTLNYNVTANNSVSDCATAASASVSILSSPNFSVVATPTAICAGSTVSLSTTNVTNPIVLNEGFNSPTNSWTKINNSTGGTASAAAWTLRPNGYVLPGSTFTGTLISNDNTQMYLTNSDQQGSGSKTRTILRSPSMSTLGMTSLNLNFHHFYKYWATGDSAVMVQVSTNGTTWTTLQDYKTGAADIGTPGAFAPATLNLNAYINNPTLYVRFNYNSTWGYGWAIDNVVVSGTINNDYDYVWTSAPAGFTSSAATATDSPAATTVYSVVITNTATSCSNSGSVSVTVNAIPTVTASASSSSVCAGSTATLTAGGATNYTWTSGGNTSTVVVTPTTTSVYTVTGSTSGCSNTATVSVDVTPSPTVMATASQTILCDDGSTGSSLLTATSNASSFLWSDGAMTMTTSVTPTVTTVYTVTATEMGCSTDAYVTVNVSNCTGINSLVASNNISVYPNPTNGIVNISISTELNGTTTVEIYDAIGKLVITEKLTKDVTSVDTSKLVDGMYMFKIINNNQSVKVGRLIKQ